MELTTAQIAYIQQDVRARGLTLDDLADSLVDHLCCAIENSTETDFYRAYATALASFGEAGLIKIQKETISLLIKKEETMKKTMYVTGYIATFLISTGLLFRLQHWTGAMIMLTLGIVLLNFAFLPMYFYNRYKRAIS